MEHTITKENIQITEETFIKYTNLWKRADVLELTHHFHKLDKSIGQYERVYYFAVNEKDITRFNAIEQIKTFKIYMALKEGHKESFTFFPIFEVVDTSDKKYYFELVAHQKPKKGVQKDETAQLGSEIVPAIFKDMISENWQKVEMSLIDDLFTVKTAEKPMERVLFYSVTPDLINPYLPGNVKELKLYPGLDMNKFQYKDMISFTPVIGLTPKLPIENNLYRMGILESDGNEVFIEYSTPCPPTCPPPIQS
ncbi:hypothetical protein [Aquimarina sp. I32.4]|uniref:hypothetical protein n=1 Tax=Aquimarina sp. I32.4 TaxID=2053903 RepID=UPI000CDEDFA1|nr:hypothetical protein [Aquimarina sp. I32.4]